MDKSKKPSGKRVVARRLIARRALKVLDKLPEDELRQVQSAFGIDNAKQMPIADTVRFFVPQRQFERLFVAKNQILLGSRGSGKTTWVRMLAHDHVMLAAQDGSGRMAYARDALQRNLIGIYVPASAAFAGDLKNKPWQSEEEAEQYFVWRLNLHVCSALTHILGSVMEQYVPDRSARDLGKQRICQLLAGVWSEGKETAGSVEELRRLLSAIELTHQAELRKRRTNPENSKPYEDHFDTDLMLPLRHAINVVRTVVHVPESATWMVCLDEVEYLTAAHHRILNTQMRASAGEFVFKIATMPFAHHTLATNLGDPVREGNDFEYVYVDREPVDRRGSQAEGEFLAFAREMFRRRISVRLAKAEGLSLRSLLGASALLDDKKVESPQDEEHVMALLRKHANPLTVARAQRLRGSPKFKNEIVRKMHGALILRDALATHHGNAKLRVYSGESTVVRCCDGNARRLMRVLNQLVQRIRLDDTGRVVLPLDAAVQNEVLESVARDTLNRVHSEPPNGAVTYTYLEAVGRFMQWQFSSSSRQLGSDQVTSVIVNDVDGEDAQRFIRQAVQLSLMIPGREVSLVAGDDAPCSGVFHLAFLFAPLFHLLPRRNDAVRLSRVVAHTAAQRLPSRGIQPSLLDFS